MLPFHPTSTRVASEKEKLALKQQITKADIEKTKLATASKTATADSLKAVAGIAAGVLAIYAIFRTFTKSDFVGCSNGARAAAIGMSTPSMLHHAGIINIPYMCY